MTRIEQSDYGGEEQLYESQPPLKWFIGIGTQSEGIKNVILTDAFGELGDGQIIIQWKEYLHFIGNPVMEEDSPERREKAASAIAKAEQIITEVTGFHPSVIASRRWELAHQYRGKMTAPFDVELY